MPGVQSQPSVLQQAVIAAWDMQEQNGPLIPAKGDIEIPAFNNPPFVPDALAPGVGARTRGETNAAFIAAPGDAASLLNVTTPTTFVIWMRAGESGGSNRVSLRAFGSGVFGGPGDGFFISQHLSRYVFGIVTETEVTDRALSTPGSILDWHRMELMIDPDAEILKAYVSSLAGDVVSQSWPLPSPVVQSQYLQLGGNRNHAGWSLLRVYNRELTPEERAADLTPRLYSQL